MHGSRAQAGELVYQSGFADPDDVDAVGEWTNDACRGAELSWFPSAWTCSEPCAEPFEPWAGYTVCDGNVDWDDAVNRTDTGTEREGSIRIWLYDEAGDGESVPTAYLTLFTEAVPEYPDVTSQLPPDFEFTPGYVYVFSAWVHTESVLSNPALGIDWLSGVDADGAPLVIPNGTYDDGQVERDTLPFPVDPIAAPWPAWNGWHRLEVPAVAPHGAVGARLRLLTRTVGDRFVPTTMAGGPGVPEFDPQPSSFWFDDVEVEEFPSLKFVARAPEAAWLDPDWTFLVPVGAEVVQPDVVEVIGGDGTASFVLASDASFCGELVIDLPPGVSLTAVTGDDPGTIDDERNVRASAVVNRGTDPISGYTAYAFEYSGDPVSGCASGTSGTIFTEQTFEWLFLSTVAPPLSELPANLYYRFEWDTPGGTVQQPTQTVVLSPFTLPVLAPEDRPQRLRVDAMASTSLGIPNGDWPGYLDLLGATGVHSFTLDSSIQAAWKSAAYRAEVESVRDEAVGVHELGLRGLLAPFSYITADGPAAIDTATVAKNALGQLPDASWDLCAGAANLPVDYEICVDPPNTHYTDELDALCVAGEMGVAWIAFDWEGRDQRTFCDPAISQFMTLYADADEDGVLGEFRRGGTVDHGDDPRFFYARAGQTTCGAGSVGESVNLTCDIVYDERDAKYEDYLAIPHRVRRRLARTLHPVDRRRRRHRSRRSFRPPARPGGRLERGSPVGRGAGGCGLRRGPPGRRRPGRRDRPVRRRRLPRGRAIRQPVRDRWLERAGGRQPADAGAAPGGVRGRRAGGDFVRVPRVQRAGPGAGGPGRDHAPRRPGHRRRRPPHPRRVALRRGHMALGPGGPAPAPRHGHGIRRPGPGSRLVPRAPFTTGAASRGERGGGGR